ncbi:hypothetical protein AMECASPLE_035858 [Ameca splendens]|uniref:Secreted protein n=1 Tax=Ameca splendens TaxID=208324 RepID=A0ABV0XKI8_9TELE
MITRHAITVFSFLLSILTPGCADLKKCRYVLFFSSLFFVMRRNLGKNRDIFSQQLNSCPEIRVFCLVVGRCLGLVNQVVRLAKDPVPPAIGLCPVVLGDPVIGPPGAERTFL